MRLSLRLILLLATGVTLLTLVVTWADVRTERLALTERLQQEAQTAADRLQQVVEPLLRRGAASQLAETLERFDSREHLAGAALRDGKPAPFAATPTVAQALTERPDAVPPCGASEAGCSAFVTLNDMALFAYSAPFRIDRTRGVLTLFYDVSDFTTRSAHVWHSALLQVVPQVLLIALITVGVVHASVLGPIRKTAHWMKDLRFGRAAPLSDPADVGLLDPMSAEAAGLAQSLASARATAEEEARLREAADSLWTPERLRVGVHNRLDGSRLFLVSNREPYEHVHRGRSVEVQVPASGLVTALEPILRACDGTWIAHGSGDADREVVDDRSRLRVPPDQPRYSLRRVWLTREEEEGYYFGFANEGLWPLCHIAYTRPMFRTRDWEHYQRVNNHFAQAVIEEMADDEAPLLLIQDYHFALLPALVKHRRPDARIGIFWHIPWPNPEAFGICPWRKELLDGMLGADIVGFHIQAHCRNFLETVDRFLECRVEWERHAVFRAGRSTLVHPHPISVALPEFMNEPKDAAAAPDWDRAAIRRDLGVEGLYVGVGVDRIDYTKGIIERFRGIERFLERYPAYIERFVFVQAGAPSRIQIARYQELLVEVEIEAERINRRFQTGTWRPILLFRRHHTHEEIARLYQIADFCLVTSLHDGMNLVAKEYVARRDDGDGVLVLSQFTGAAAEMHDALLVNPYDIDQVASAIKTALEMPGQERRERMRRMRRGVREHNVYKWAADLISELADVRTPAARASAPPVEAEWL
jgi:trehalose 6-phosphate synthase